MAKKKIDWILVMVFLIAFLVRWKCFLGGIEWNNIDNVRDILIAKHINLYAEYPQRGPTAAGGFGVLLNSSFYYYFWAWLWKIFPSEKVIPTVMMVLGMGTLFLSNLIAKSMLKNKWFRYLFLLWIALSPELIKASVDPSQPAMAMFWTLLAVWGVVKFYESGKRKYLWYLIVGNWLSLETHYSVFSVYPLLILLMVVALRKWKPRFSRTMLAAGLGTICIWILTTYKNVFGDQINYLQNFFAKSDFNIGSLLKGIEYFGINLWQDSTGLVPEIYGWWIGILLIPLVWALIKMYKSRDIWFGTWIGGLFLGLILAATQLKISYSAVQYIKIYTIFLPLLWVYMMEKVFRGNLVKVLALLILILAKGFYFRTSGFEQISTRSNEVVKKISDLIYDDAQINFKEKDFSFRIWESDNGGEMYDFCSVIFWYWLEKNTGRHLVRLDVEESNTFYPIKSKDLDYGYLVCTNVGNFFDISGCRDDFVKKTGIETKRLTLLGSEKPRWYVYRVGLK